MLAACLVTAAVLAWCAVQAWDCYDGIGATLLAALAVTVAAMGMTA